MVSVEYPTTEIWCLHTFRFRFIFFCSAAAITVFPLTNSLSASLFGLAGRDELAANGPVEFGTSFLGVVTPVL